MSEVVIALCILKQLREKMDGGRSAGDEENGVKFSCLVLSFRVSVFRYHLLAFLST